MKEVLASIKNIQELITVCIDIVEQSSRLLDHLCHTAGAATGLSAGFVCATTNSLTNLLFRCRRMSVLLDRLNPLDGNRGGTELSTTLNTIEDEMIGVSSCLQSIVEDLQRSAERCGCIECGDVTALILRIQSLN